MNTIIAYLETMFSAYPKNPRILEAKAELQGMMEDAYHTLIAAGHSENEAVGQVIRDFGNLEEVAPVLGITSDLTGSPAAADAAEAPQQHPVVTTVEAQGYATAMERIRYRFSTAIMLFVISPAAVIILPVAASMGLLPFTAEVGVFIGLLTILVFVSIGVVMILATTREVAPYRRIPEGRFTPNPAVTLWADALAAQHESRRIRALQVAIVLWILAAVPLIAFALLLGEAPMADLWVVIGVVIVLVVVAAGLGVLLPQLWAHTVAEELRLGGNNTALVDSENSIVNVIAAFYWPLMAAIFLAWSFIGNAWGISWIIWPIAGVFFAAIAAGTNAIESYRSARR